jgi:hypothetical protein
MDKILPSPIVRATGRMDRPTALTRLPRMISVDMGNNLRTNKQRLATHTEKKPIQREDKDRCRNPLNLAVQKSKT